MSQHKNQLFQNKHTKNYYTFDNWKTEIQFHVELLLKHFRMCSICSHRYIRIKYINN